MMLADVNLSQPARSCKESLAQGSERLDKAVAKDLQATEQLRDKIKGYTCSAQGDATLTKTTSSLNHEDQERVLERMIERAMQHPKRDILVLKQEMTEELRSYIDDQSVELKQHVSEAAFQGRDELKKHFSAVNTIVLPTLGLARTQSLGPRLSDQRTNVSTHKLGSCNVTQLSLSHPIGPPYYAPLNSHKPCVSFFIDFFGHKRWSISQGLVRTLVAMYSGGTWQVRVAQPTTATDDSLLRSDIFQRIILCGVYRLRATRASNRHQISGVLCFCTM
jgi:hypothetical protein